MSGPACVVIVASPDHPGRLYVRYHAPDGELLLVGTVAVKLAPGQAPPTGQCEVLLVGGRA